MYTRWGGSIILIYIWYYYLNVDKLAEICTLATVTPKFKNIAYKINFGVIIGAGNIAINIKFG